MSENLEQKKKFILLIYSIIGVNKQLTRIQQEKTREF